MESLSNRNSIVNIQPLFSLKMLQGWLLGASLNFATAQRDEGALHET